MTIDTITALAEKIAREIEDAKEEYGVLDESDPELWENLFGEYIAVNIKTYRPEGSAAETDAFRRLYAETKIVMDEALMPSELWEALHVMEYQISDTLTQIARKSAVVGAEILNDLKSTYVIHKDENISAAAKSIAVKIEKMLTPKTKEATVFNQAADSAGAGPLAGKTIVFTGTLSKTRKESSDIATALGARVAGTVSKNTDYLVAGEDAGSKIQKAAALGVTVLTEAQWNALTQQKGPESTSSALPRPFP